VLAELYPNQPAARLERQAAAIAGARVDAGVNYPSDVDAGMELGRRVADRVIEYSRNDGSDARWDGSRPGPGARYWEPPPGSAARPVSPVGGTWDTWVMDSGSQLRVPPPPAFGTPGFREQARAVVRAQEELTPEQKRAAKFWEGGEGTALPPGIWMQVVLERLRSEPLTTPRTTRLFATLTVAMDDAGVRAQAAPRWERVATLRGSGAASETVRIDRGAVQWRVRWRCSGSRRFAVSQEPAPDEGNPIGSGRCPGTGEASSVDTGELELAVRTSGRWRAVVEQQMTDPVAEPPLPAMQAQGAEVLARGRFYPIERRGRGEAVLHELPDGRLALRLEGFETSANTDLFVWLSETSRPRTTKQALRSRHAEFAPLKATKGSQNYLLPANADADSIRSIVIWCQPIRIAYTAAVLR
jgi:hypothetical protein